jgi:hypothetical protein
MNSCIYMARRKLSERHIRKLTKTANGKSFSITLPIEMVRNLRWRERQKLVVKLRGKKITVEDWKKKK